MMKIFWSLLIAFLLTGCTQIKDKDVVSENKLAGNALGTTYHITYLGKPIDDIERNLDSLITDFNRALSTYQESSLISYFNANRVDNDGLFTIVDTARFTNMVQLSKDVVNATGGAFDPSAARLYQEYLIAKKESRPMNDSLVTFYLTHQGLGNISVSATNFTKRDSLIELNFNAIAKGYLVDEVCELLENNGTTDYLVEIGGETRVSGTNKNGDVWRIGLNQPDIDANQSDFFDILELQDIAIATSGNYQNYYKINDQIIGHTLDPRSGKPVINDLKSASILHSSCAVADAYATACMVLGLEKSKKLVQADSTLSAYFIYDSEGKLCGEFVK